MNTVLNSREEALDRGKLISLDDEALDAGYNSSGPQVLS